MGKYLDAIRDALDYTKKVNELLKSDLSFDEKLDYINRMLLRRKKALDLIAQATEEETYGSKRLLEVLTSIDKENSTMMKAMLDEKKAQIEEIRTQKIGAMKQGAAQRKYMMPADEAGYYINNFK